jgi:hypothetical protein
MSADDIFSDNADGSAVVSESDDDVASWLAVGSEVDCHRGAETMPESTKVSLYYGYLHCVSLTSLPHDI